MCFLLRNMQAYFLDCPLYNTEPKILMIDLRNFNFNLTLRNLLYGDDKLSDELNELAYLSIQYFMKETKLSIDWDEGFGQHRFRSVVKDQCILSLRLFVYLLNFIYILVSNLFLKSNFLIFRL